MKLNKKHIEFIDVVNFYERRRANLKIKTGCKKKICICNDFICCCTKYHDCKCDDCKLNFDFVNNTKLKYNNMTKKYIKKLIECTELKKS